MLQLTIGEALEGAIDTSKHCLYLYREKEAIFYIGRSTSPLDRLQEHLGRGLYSRPLSLLGTLILAHAPDSFSWDMELRTIEDCAVLICSHRPEYYEWYLQQMNKRLAREASELAEEVLIEYYRPHLNIMGNSQRQPLPERYRHKLFP
jgi:hypothetical protein